MNESRPFNEQMSLLNAKLCAAVELWTSAQRDVVKAMESAGPNSEEFRAAHRQERMRHSQMTQAGAEMDSLLEPWTGPDGE